ncbi:MAG TPA: ABC transporter permease [Acidimicrobiales bacterium]|nr:ABC transporter permease [Acidimicrobiales bacterium]
MTTPSSAGAGGGRVYDRGYRRYEGPRGGRGAAVRALFLGSIRRALGLRRSWKQKVLPWLLLAVAAAPAAVFVGVGYVTRNTPAADFEFITYRDYVGVSTALLLFVAVTAPDLICPERRQRVLPLIFSRPLTGRDYVLAKAGAVFAVVFAFGFLPQVLLFVGQMLVSDAALTYLRQNAEVLWQAPLSVAVLAAFLALLGTAVASLATRRMVAAAAFLGLFLVSSSVSGVLVAGGDGSAAALVNVISLPLFVRDLVFLGHIGNDTPLGGLNGGGALAVACYVAVTGACVAILLARYRWAER